MTIHCLGRFQSLQAVVGELPQVSPGQPAPPPAPAAHVHAHPHTWPDGGLCIEMPEHNFTLRLADVYLVNTVMAVAVLLNHRIQAFCQCLLLNNNSCLMWLPRRQTFATIQSFLVSGDAYVWIIQSE